MRQYRSIFIGRSREAAQFLDIPWTDQSKAYPARLTPVVLARWFVNSKAATIAPATFRIYRASIAWGIKQFFSNDESTAEALEILTRAKATKKSVITEEFGKRSSADKSKGLTKKRFEQLKSVAIKKRQLSMAPIALHLLQATMVTGLRPAEWISSERVTLGASKKKKYMFGVKAKTIKQGAGNTNSMDSRLPYRTIPVPLFSDSTESEIASVEACITYATKIRLSAVELNLSTEEFDRVVTLIWTEKVTKMGRAIRVLSDAANMEFCSTTNRESTTLYSARHQFKTDAQKLLKKSIRSKKEVNYLLSALMGHNNPDTQKGYGLTSKSNYDDDQNQAIYVSTDLIKQAQYLANIIQNT
jgi:hypothetical protein